jgi:hypothetical protein
MTEPVVQDNLTAKQNDYAVFLPAISGFYATFIGKQRNEPYVDPARFLRALLIWSNLTGSTPPKHFSLISWSYTLEGMLISILLKQDWSEDMVRNREPGTFILGDSGGFQIAKGLVGR